MRLLPSVVRIVLRIPFADTSEARVLRLRRGLAYLPRKGEALRFRLDDASATVVRFIVRDVEHAPDAKSESAMPVADITADREGPAASSANKADATFVSLVRALPSDPPIIAECVDGSLSIGPDGSVEKCLATVHWSVS
jgi:hypothetical protein